MTITQFNQTGETKLNEQEATATTVRPAALSETYGSTTSSAGDNGHPGTVTPQTEPAHRLFPYPAWPISRPGPMAPPPPTGQHPHALRTDQMVYEGYDQEHGIPCAPTFSSTLQKKRKEKTDLPDNSTEDPEAVTHWQDNGGFSGRETLSQASSSPASL